MRRLTQLHLSSTAQISIAEFSLRTPQPFHVNLFVMDQNKLLRARISRLCGRVLRETRESHGLTQEQLAERTGLHRTTISLFERGLQCPALDTIWRLAYHMGTDPAALVAKIVRLEKRIHE